MQKTLRTLLRATITLLLKKVMRQKLPVQVQRRWLGKLNGLSRTARGARIEHGTWGVPGLWVRHRDRAAESRVILYLHGGGYTLGTPEAFKGLCSHLAAATRGDVLVPAYRLAPEHPYPAAVEDAVAAYRALLDRYLPGRIAIGGDSAGAGLALCTALALREAGLPLPSALLLISPWLDLSLSGDSMTSQRECDPMLTREWLQSSAEAYRGSLSLTDPRISPLFAALDGLPPMLIQVGSDEILLSDSQRLAERARAVGLDVRLQVEDGLWHDFQMHAGVLDAADAAIRRIADFVNETSLPRAKDAACFRDLRREIGVNR